MKRTGTPEDFLTLGEMNVDYKVKKTIEYSSHFNHVREVPIIEVHWVPDGIGSYYIQLKYYTGPRKSNSSHLPVEIRFNDKKSTDRYFMFDSSTWMVGPNTTWDFKVILSKGLTTPNFCRVDKIFVRLRACGQIRPSRWCPVEAQAEPPISDDDETDVPLRPASFWNLPAANTHRVSSAVSATYLAQSSKETTSKGDGVLSRRTSRWVFEQGPGGKEPEVSSEGYIKFLEDYNKFLEDYSKCLEDHSKFLEDHIKFRVS